jgi:hypothetical protein
VAPDQFQAPFVYSLDSSGTSNADGKFEAILGSQSQVLLLQSVIHIKDRRDINCGLSNAIFLRFYKPDCLSRSFIAHKKYLEWPELEMFTLEEEQANSHIN